MSGSAPDAEAELERFRAQWRQEVNARNKKPERESSSTTKAEDIRLQRRKVLDVPAPTTAPLAGRSAEIVDYSEEVEPRSYHDLPDKEELLQLGEEGQNHDRHPFKEPSSALEHYERAVERETTGLLGESIKHYRTAFKLDDGVHEAYKRKHFPPSSFKSKPPTANPPNVPVTVSNPAHSSLHGGGKSSSTTLPQHVRSMIDEFSSLRIEPAPPPTDASPQKPSPLGDLPEEILSEILHIVAVTDIASFNRLAQVCRRLAYLTFTEESIWKTVAMGDDVGFSAMHYEFVCDVEGFSLEANDSIARYLDSYSYDDRPQDMDAPPAMPEQKALAFSALSEKLLHSTYASSWRQMFRARPRIRFNGCYISTVNYTRAGAASSNTLTWGAPVHVVTYFRYLRFFRDGTVISLLTTAEPMDVVHHLIKDNLHNHHGNVLPSRVMKDGLRGRWRLSGPASSVSNPSSSADKVEDEGEVHVETEGVVSKYTYKLLLALSHAGKGARNNKLAWKGFWSYNRLTDDWAEFGLKNDRAFYWSRVKSFGMAR